jgi:signal transduction histidine kinase
VTRAALRRLALMTAMVAIVAAIAGVAYWDAEREEAAALQDFAAEQATLAGALGAALRTRAARGPGAFDTREVLAELRSIERPSALVILVRRAGEPALRATDGREVRSQPLIDAFARGDSVLRLGRPEASAFGLPARTALAGLSRVDAGAAGPWDVVAVASAEHERDRELRAHRRLVLSVATAAALVLAFGGVAMRNQRKELLLERELAVATVRQARDERLERASKAAAMGTLAMGVAHEIATPLGVITARAEQIASRVAGDDRLSSNAAAIVAQTGRIDRVIRGLLGLARGDTPSAQRIDPRALLDRAVGLVEHRFMQACVPLRREIEPGLPAVIGDAGLLEHAIVNLLLNACDACKNGGGVAIAVRNGGGEGGAPREIEIAVEDSGVGMAAADVERALEPFFTTKAREGGTGLGLAIAREIVANHRGTLSIARAEPRGTRAAIRLPAAEGQADG